MSKEYVLVAETGHVGANGAARKPTVEELLCPKCREHLPEIVECFARESAQMFAEIEEIAKLVVKGV